MKIDGTNFSVEHYMVVGLDKALTDYYKEDDDIDRNDYDSEVDDPTSNFWKERD